MLRNITVVVVGASQTGKTSLVRSFISGEAVILVESCRTLLLRCKIILVNVLLKGVVLVLQESLIACL